MESDKGTNVDPDLQNDPILKIINDLVNTINKLWESFKNNMNSVYEFMLEKSEKHFFSLLILSICIALFTFVKIPKNWNIYWHHGFYFGLVIMVGLAMFRFDMENIIDKGLDKDTRVKTLKDNYKERNEIDGLMKRQELLRKLLNGEKMEENVKNEYFKSDSEIITNYNKKISDTTEKKIKAENEKKALDEVIQAIQRIQTYLNTDYWNFKCDKIKEIIERQMSYIRDIKKLDAGKKDEYIKNLREIFNMECDDDDSNNKRSFINDASEKISKMISDIKDEKNKIIIKAIDSTSINKIISDLKKDYDKKKNKGEDNEREKAKQRKIPKTLIEQMKAYFKYLAITSCSIFLIFLLFKLYEVSGRSVRYGIHMIIVMAILGLLFYIAYTVSSKREMLRPSWQKTESTAEIGAKQKEEDKIKRNNNTDNTGFVILRLITRPFVMFFYFIYGFMCNVRDYFTDLMDPKKRAQKQREWEKWKDQNLSYMVIIVLGLSFLFVQYILPYAERYSIDIYSTTLLKDPVYLEKLKVLGNENRLRQEKGRDFSFCLSAWIYIEESNPNHNISSNMNATVINYGELPHLTYNVRTNTASVFLKKGSDVKQVIYQIQDLPKQKWHQFVFNYDHGVMDVYLNGELVATSSGIMPYMTMDEIYVGQNKGIRGGIKDVVYHFKKRSKLSIETSYYLSKFRSYLML